MKSFIVSLLVLALIIILTIVNSYCITSTTNSLITKVQSLSLDDTYKINELSDYFEKKLFFISLSCSNKETDKIHESIIILKKNIEKHDNAGFDERKSLLINYIMQIQEHEKITLSNIF